MWNASTQDLLISLQKDNDVVGIKFYGNEGVLVSVLVNGDVSFVNIFTGEIVMEFPTEPNVTDMNFSSTGEYFV